PAWLKFIGEINPVSYMVDILRFCLIDQSKFGFGADLAVIAATLLVALVFAVNRFNRIQV
ncbi:MAG: hypothetical protein ACREO5_12205, partial [Candidatus Binatia bacterium]